MLSDTVIMVLMDVILIGKVVVGFGLVGFGVLLLMLSKRSAGYIAAAALWALVGAFILSGLMVGY